MSGDTPTQDLFGAVAARDEALAKVAANGNNWRYLALAGIANLPAGYEGTGEDIRIKMLNDGLPPPHHHNAWGEVIKAAVSRAWIVPTGKYRNMRTRKSHARETPVYRRAGALKNG